MFKLATRHLADHLLAHSGQEIGKTRRVLEDLCNVPPSQRLLELFYVHFIHNLLCQFAQRGVFNVAQAIVHGDVRVALVQRMKTFDGRLGRGICNVFKRRSVFLIFRKTFHRFHQWLRILHACQEAEQAHVLVQEVRVLHDLAKICQRNAAENLKRRRTFKFEGFDLFEGLRRVRLPERLAGELGAEGVQMLAAGFVKGHIIAADGAQDVSRGLAGFFELLCAVFALLQKIPVILIKDKHGLFRHINEIHRHKNNFLKSWRLRAQASPVIFRSRSVSTFRYFHTTSLLTASSCDQ